MVGTLKRLWQKFKNLFKKRRSTRSPPMDSSTASPTPSPVTQPEVSEPLTSTYHQDEQPLGAMLHPGMPTPAQVEEQALLDRQQTMRHRNMNHELNRDFVPDTEE
jgi:hypothetical protein